MLFTLDRFQFREGLRQGDFGGVGYINQAFLTKLVSFFSSVFLELLVRGSETVLPPVDKVEQLCFSHNVMQSTLLKCTACLPEVESSRTSLASRTHFEVLGLEASSPWPWPLPRSLKSTKIALSSARGQHYFLNS